MSTAKKDKTNQPTRERIAEIIAALQWGPKTIEDLVGFTGCATSTVRDWVNAFHASGLVRISARMPREKGEGAQQFQRRRIVWAWQAKPFETEDIAV